MEAARRGAEMAAERKRQHDTALAEGDRLLAASQWAGAEQAFGNARSVAGFENDAPAVKGIEAARAGAAAAAERTRQYERAIADGESLLEAERWTEAEAAFVRALTTPGHEREARATKGRAEAQYHTGTCYATGTGVTKDEREAAKWYTRAAEQDHAGAQRNLGMCYANGVGVAKDEREAVKWYIKAAEQGDAEAQCNLGNCHFAGTGVQKDEAAAAKWYRKAAEQDYARGQYNLGGCYEDGTGVARDEKEAANWFAKAAKGFRTAAEQGDVRSQCLLGECLKFGRGVQMDEAEAVKWTRKAAEQNYARAQSLLGWCYLTGNGVTKDEREAVSWFRKAAEQGLAEAQRNLGLCYADGVGVAKDEREAAEWHLKAAEQGNADAQNNLGWCYQTGTGVTKDEGEAVKWYRKAAEQGDAEAQCNLGWCCQSGTGVTKDEREAVIWYRKAAEHGSVEAQLNLGVCYQAGRGVAMDEQEAAKWYRKAAEQDYAGGQFALGLCYENGIGVTKDGREAVKLYRKAAEQGNAEAKEALGRLGDGVSGEGAREPGGGRSAPAAPSTVAPTLPVAGPAWTVPQLGLELVWVAPGSFQMGSNDGSDDEKPVHAVRISRGFLIGKYEVTQAEYEAVMGKNPSRFKGARNPVENVSWDDAAAFCAKLTERGRAAGRLPAGYEYRLPTEAEWEYAARGGASSKGYTYAGSNTVDEVAWYSSNSGFSTHQVGQKQPNELGLYDMSGNVWEWCLDDYDGSDYAKSPDTDPVNLQTGSVRVDRGGGWFFDAGDLRPACRHGYRPDYVYFSLGFRACLAPAITAK
jgi:TPR repeat protein